jgi:hypothetical protein
MGRQVGQDAHRRPGGTLRRLKGVDGEERRYGGDCRDEEDGQTPGTHPAARAKPNITAGSAAVAWHPTALSSLPTP